ncbi:MAG: hypothetical protein K5925_04535 [Bacilli bacterium]|nr:hypothetical protein [Bacilli bacterium]
MNAKLQDIYSNYLNQTEEERIAVAQKATAAIAGFFSESGLTQKESLNFYINIVRLFVSADRRCSQQEVNLFNKILGVDYSYEDFFNLTNGGSNPEFVKAMDDIIDTMPEEPKIAVCVLGLTLLAADGELKESEIDIFERILE